MRNQNSVSAILVFPCPQSFKVNKEAMLEHVQDCHAYFARPILLSFAQARQRRQFTEVPVKFCMNGNVDRR